ncbi:MAG: hypothetical protein ACOZE5_04685 [Verrucomicrobiota bacterium]
MSLLTRLERTLGRFAIPNLSLYLIGGQVLFFSVSLLAEFDVGRIMLLPALVLQGEVWRLFTFVLVPPVYGQLSMTGALFLAISWYFFSMISQALEHHWGAYRFNLFFLIGWFLTVAVSFLTPNRPTGYEFFAVSVFLAFALLNPDFELYLFFILPVKIKWFALLMWLGFAYAFVTGGWNVRLAILAATGNFFLFFAGEIVQRMKTGRRHMQQQVRRTALREAGNEPRHRCVVCGKTDLSHPLEEFRYGDDDQCYCSAHRGGGKKA